MTPLPDFQLEIFFSRWEFAARHNLAASDAQTLTIGELLELGNRGAFEALPLSYAPTWGTPELLEAVAATYDAVGPEHVLAFAGADVFASALGEVPQDRFRLGAGRRDPGPALDALAGFLDVENGGRRSCSG